MSTLDIFKTEGEQIGLQKGEQIGLQKGEDKKTKATCVNMIQLGFDDDTICRVLEVTPEFIAEVRKELAED